LRTGLLEKSQNGRMDRNGEWQPRIGVNNKVAPIANGVSALKVIDGDATNFTIIDPDATTSITSNSDGSVLTIANFGSIANTPSTGSIKISNCSISGADGVHPYTKSGSNFLVTNVAGTFANSGSDSTCTTAFGILNDDAVNGIYASCNFSDPNSAQADDYIILISNTQAFAIRTSDQQSYTLNYPTGQTVAEQSDVIQAFNKIIIFRKPGTASANGQPPLELDTATNNITSSPTFSNAPSGAFTQPVSLFASAGDFNINNLLGTFHTTSSFAVGDSLILEDSGAVTTGLFQNTSFSINKVYTQGSSKAISAFDCRIDGSASTTATFTCTGHELSVGEPVTIASVDAAVNGNNVVSAVASADSFSVEIGTASSTNATGLSGTALRKVGISFIIQPNSISVPRTKSELSLSTPIFIKKVASDLGFIHNPASEFGILHQGRLVVPFRFDPEDGYVSRKAFDELIISDILDSNTYDRIFASLRFNAGTSDFTVGLTSFVEDSVIVFNKNSVHRITGLVNPRNAKTQILTTEVGAAARRSIVQVGKNIYFLSDNGVYSLEFLDEYNLRGTQTPLSESIKTTINRINPNLIDQSVACYFDNRYYLAVPLDSREGANDATRNNALIIYNFLNKAWESVDEIATTLPDGTTIPVFEYDNLIVSGKGTDRGVYTVNQHGGIHQVAGNEANYSPDNLTGTDRVITTIGTQTPQKPLVNGLLKTRMYTMKDIDRKKFKSFDIAAEGQIEESPSDFSIKIQVENIDLELNNEVNPIATASGVIGKEIPFQEDVSLRGRIGNVRGYGLQYQIENTKGRPKIKTIKTSATQSFKSLTPTE
jgi:hypothetical protein